MKTKKYGRPATLAAPIGALVHPKLLVRCPNLEIDAHVLPPCKEDGGRWACNGCGATFDNNMDHWNHTKGPGHRRVWLCHTHGPETVCTCGEAVRAICGHSPGCPVGDGR